MTRTAYAPVPTTPVDEVALEARAAELCSRSIKTTSKRAALHLAIRCMDLTTLEGVDTPGKVSSLCRKAIRPDATDPSVPSVAAVCVYPEMVAHAAATVAAASASDASAATTASSAPTSADASRSAAWRSFSQSASKPSI